MLLLSDNIRRNPYPLYAQMRATAPTLHDPESGLWMVFDYDGVKRVFSNYPEFSARFGPEHWFSFSDPPQHTRMRALISQAFTANSVSGLEPRIATLSRELIDRKIEGGRMDLVLDYAMQLPILVIAEMLGIPTGDRERINRWNSVMVFMSHSIVGSTEKARANQDFAATTVEMAEYLDELLAQRRATPTDDLLTRLLRAEIDGERLTAKEILGFFQLLLLAGSETTTYLITNAILCFLAHPDQLARVLEQPELLSSAIEEVLRYRSPVQWLYRVTRSAVEINGQTIPAGKLVLAMIGSANRDPKHFPDPQTFDVTRSPNPHVAFGHGSHFCLGAPLARLEARIALAHLLQRLENLRPASNTPWTPRKGLHVHGPESLPILFESN